METHKKIQRILTKMTHGIYIILIRVILFTSLDRVPTLGFFPLSKDITV